ncbi:unnamed protein product [Taenia asiatica]|uniref:Rhomboid domain-containing protein n=1 Tax=Taenia asiatica TaxID=60517 RepID=A0A158R797_TAEAS|nr:unnamed protein product [Taenia asiatica]
MSKLLAADTTTRSQYPYTVLSIILLLIQCVLNIRHLTHKCALTTFIVVLLVTAHVCGLPALAAKLTADFDSVLARGNLMLLLLASLTHRDEWHLYYCLALFIRYGVAAEKHFREFDFLLYLFVLTFASGIISLALYRLAFLISGDEKFNNAQILGFSETATTLGVLYCLNAHGIFKEFRLPWGHHLKVTNRFQRWLSFFLSDIRRLLQFPMGFLNPIIAGLMCWFLFEPLRWSRRRLTHAA